MFEMALMAIVLLATLALFGDTYAVPLAADNTTRSDVSVTPADTSSQAQTAFSMLSSPTPTDPTSASVLTTYPSSTSTPRSTLSLVLAEATPSSSTLDSDSDSVPDSLLSFLSSLAGALTSTSSTDSTSSTSAQSTTTVVSTVYQSAPTTTTTAPPKTVTDTITIVPPPTPSSTIQDSTAWTAPPQMTDLSAFNIKNFAYGKNNVRLIVSDPPQEDKSDSPPDTLTGAALAVLSAVGAGLIPPPPNKTTNSFLQLYYPANSINPGQKPQGGADFYATPLDLSRARNVSMEYSVFFPSDFDWVEGGKMPGIYGGHDGCSGGDDALDCFSTRLMWRSNGAGELYLYAPKDKQTAALCKTPPQSVCDSDYGFSIGRGAFYFAAGKWTHIRQTVVLNTPGEQDGGFTLDVNGKRVIERSDIFYRDDPSGDAGSGASALTEEAVKASSALGMERDFFNQTAGRSKLKVDSVLSDANALAPARVARDFTPEFAPASYWPEDVEYTPKFTPMWDFIPRIGVSKLAPIVDDDETVTTTIITTTVVLPTSTVTAGPTTTETVYVMAMETGVPVGLSGLSKLADREPVGFTGLFFSTFFGGHEPKFATPKDQFSWFKDFSMTIND
ncbi:hypothetical protein L226DRAFT_488914 [Lentinus tigrinus ALCF2SS1-7]|uniref:Polysaccharide lyase 14 domain-containing protein n=1 Tax=Lentinus tigrinus ALCF2SS1-6 TaxID=1328759 RepID=A0A5C2S646_9APHY|nr:hypothetical protein L227DRAFT_527954 [Lentinus tigrinus ALCF2SS1-6]RPD73622.1 hypothetical protein L226DRAFT_488914 [Lentinus tigrinus ALCF2SS1-7]